MTKYTPYCCSVDRLEEAISTYSFSSPKGLREVIRDACIRRFSLSVNLALKTMSEYLFEEGISSIPDTPKGIIREAYAAYVISDNEIWCDLLCDWNLIPEIYNDEIARQIFARVCTDYLYVLKKLKEDLAEK